MGCKSEEISQIAFDGVVIIDIPEAEKPTQGSGGGADLDNAPAPVDGAYPGEPDNVFPPSNQPSGSGSDIEMEAGEMAPPQDVVAEIDPDPSLGALSKKYESNGKPTAIGRDNTGGYSYGEYQIATKVGTFNNYLAYLEANDPATFAALTAPYGGSRTATNSAALAGGATFKNHWVSVMSDPTHAETQHGFIQATHHQPAVDRIVNSVGLDVSTRSKALQDALWSTAVQHGPGGANTIFQRAINRAGVPADQITDEELIIAVYDERGADNGRKYFGRSTGAIRSSVVNRFVNEKSDALSMLG